VFSDVPPWLQELLLRIPENSERERLLDLFVSQRRATANERPSDVKPFSGGPGPQAAPPSKSTRRLSWSRRKLTLLGDYLKKQ
jgi:hypothetical protein